MSEPISISALVQKSRSQAFAAFTSPEAITQWNQASEDWHCPFASVDLKIGGTYLARMAAKDGSFAFDFEGTIEALDEPSLFALRLGDGRLAKTSFTQEVDGVRVTTIFDPEDTHPLEMQRQGWQAILDSYAKFVDGSET